MKIEDLQKGKEYIIVHNIASKPNQKCVVTGIMQPDDLEPGGLVWYQIISHDDEYGKMLGETIAWCLDNFNKVPGISQAPVNANVPVVHEIKCWIPFFDELRSGIKTFEVRRDDRLYKVGDEIVINEYNNEIGFITGRFIHREISCILPGGQFGIQPGYCVLGLKII